MGFDNKGPTESIQEFAVIEGLILFAELAVFLRLLLAVARPIREGASLGFLAYSESVERSSMPNARTAESRDRA